MTHFLRRILFTYLPPFWKQCLLQMVCVAILIAWDTIFPLGTKFLIDLAIIPHDRRMLVLLITGLAILYILSSGGSLVSDYLIARVASLVLNQMRLKMFSHLQNLPASYYAQIQIGDVITRFNTDLAAIEYALTFSVLPGIQFVLQLIISIVVLFLLDVPLAIMTMIILPLVTILPKFFADRATSLTTQRRVEEAQITNTIQENLQAQAVTRMFSLRDFSIVAFTRQLDKLAAIATRSAFFGWLVNRTTNMGQFLIQLLVVAIGAYLVFLGKMTIGSLVGFTTLLISMGYAVSLVSVAFAGLIPAVASLERVESLLNEKIMVNDSPDVALPRFSREICFEKVTFSYAGPEGKPNLSDVNFRIPCGSSVAFIGRSGSGKSTLLNLLMRSYDPQAGEILVDGRNIQKVSLASLRSQMGVVFQDTFLFNTSLRENIRMGMLGASNAEVEEAARAAGVHETILGLPAGYDTLAGDQGKGLSGGQRQRIALARAIIRRPAILLLDEATSALDPANETLIYDTLKSLRRSCTILSVTHRLAPVADMDLIIVLDQGRVAEMGTPAQLMNRKGLYLEMASHQGGFTISPDGQSAVVTPARLGSIPLFEGLDEASLERFASQFVAERVESGQVVIREGETGGKFYIIVRGKVAVSALNSRGESVALGNGQDGDHFGEIALLEGGLRSATVRTVQPSLFLSLDRKHFLNMLDTFPEVRKAVEQTARKRRSASNERIVPEGGLSEI
jgi:ATP-binding cassette subfamily B protein